MHQLKKRKFLDEKITLQTENPKEYYLDIFKEIIQEIRENNESIIK
ncbi:MAG: hypothetical protein ACFE8E_13555 [Candidatus Hodarchaeota archaeon]